MYEGDAVKRLLTSHRLPASVAFLRTPSASGVGNLTPINFVILAQPRALPPLSSVRNRPG
jgi:hypothetical protein